MLTMFLLGWLIGLGTGIAGVVLLYKAKLFANLLAKVYNSEP